MDGAIILNASATRIVSANIQLMPDPTIASSETGTRHRTAERVAKQTGGLVISISQARDTVSLYVKDIRYQLESIAEVLAKTNQAVATLETYRNRLDQVSSRLTALEFQNAATLDDVLVVLQRAEMATRMGEEIERNVIELGREGRLIDMQLTELMEGVPRDRTNLVRDYLADSNRADDHAGAPRRSAVPPAARLLRAGRGARARRREPARPGRHAARLPRAGARPAPHRRDRHAPSSRRSAGSTSWCARRSASSSRWTASGPPRPREIREGLRRLQEHNLMDRYLQL